MEDESDRATSEDKAAKAGQGRRRKDATADFRAAVAFLEKMPTFMAHTRDEAVAIFNGAVGDRLAAEDSPLAIQMQLRDAGGVLDVARAISKEDGRGVARQKNVVVLVHGLMATERYWAMGPDGAFAKRLEEELPNVSVVRLRYNTGRHISENGRQCSDLLGQLVAQWPTEVASITLVGHSMGGLVCRSAALYGLQEAKAPRDDDEGPKSQPWFPKLKRQFLLGVPSRGAPLEMVAHVATFTLKAIPNPWTIFLGWAVSQRSAGIKDLRHGYLVDEEWMGRNPDAPSFGRKHPPELPSGVDHYVIASTLTTETDTPLGNFLRSAVGDSLVIPWSAKDAVVHGEMGEHLAAPVRFIPNLAHAQVGWSRRARRQVIDWLSESMARDEAANEPR